MSSTMKKHLQRVKQIADQTFLRGEKTDVLTKDLIIVEKRVDLIKQSCQTAGKKISACLLDMGSETSTEKRQKKVPQMALAQCMQDCSNNLSKDSVLGIVLEECANAQFAIGNELLSYQTEVEKDVLNPIINILENDIHNISKLRKHLGKLTLEMDLARTKYQTAVRHSQQATSSGTTSANKIDLLKDELEDSSQKVDQCRDALAAEMFTLISQEPYLSRVFVQWHQLQVEYHKSVLQVLQSMLPNLEKRISDYPQKPVYGQPLEEHLSGTGRQIALVIEECVCFLLEFAINEEGLFRIAGSASKVKKLKSAFDVGIVDMAEYVRDPHAVAGALKSYLRELPESLMTKSLYEDWINAAKITEFEPRLQALWQVVHKLPEPFLSNLRYIIKFLARLTMNAEVNKMSSQNIAIVMAPNLIWAGSLDDDSSHLGMNMAVANLHSSLVDTLIMYNDWFFPEEVVFPVHFSSVPSNSSDNINANVTEGGHSNSRTSNGEVDEYGPDVSNLSTSPTSQSPRVFHRPGKKPAPPAPPQGREKPQLLPEKSAGDRSSFLCLDKMQKDSNFERTNSMRDAMVKQQKAGKSDRIVSTLPRNTNMSGERSGKAERPSILRRKSNDNLFGFTTQEKIMTSKPEIPEKPVPYSTKSLERPNRTDKPERPPSAPGRSSRTSVNEDKSHSAPPEITVIHRSQIERPSVPPPERPAKPEKPTRPPSLDNSNSFSPLGDSLKTNGLDVSSMGILLDDTNSSKVEVVPQVTLEEFDPLGTHKQLSIQSSTAVQAAPLAQTKPDKWDFLITPSSEKPPDRPPRSSPHAQDSTEKGEVFVDHQVLLIGPEKPPRCHSPHAASAQSADVEKQATGHVVPTATPRVPPSPCAARQKPPRPQPPPPPSKLRISSSMENTHL